ncbi:rRNA biogenesis protein RRP5 [Argentina anserina]|uniref:rRNA biogenesis protein RRP5 n=1 Tax=Argentina anserina TaxID=57926 RepID=UPI0021762481|nr:rRNA biogenesis protein RRP5 [Potentilla anserina]
MAPSSKKPQKNPRDPPKFNKSSKKPFKPTKDHNNTNAAAALQLDDDVPDFPRGGGSSLNRKERDEIRAEVDAEFEAEERDLNKKKKRAPKESQEDELGSLFGDGISGKLPRYANKITIKNITPGIKVWGVVAEVNEKDLVISLPGGLRGLVRASDAFDPILDDETEALVDSVLPSMFRIGQLVSCIVLQLDEDKKEKGKQKIWLSLRLSLLHKGFTLDSVQEGMVLTAYIKSVEDHGYILHFGSSSFTGFLQKISQADGKEVQMSSGQLLQAAVKRVDKIRKVVHMSSDSEIVSKSVTKDLKGISIDLLVPGMMVNARVLSTLENGVMLSFLTYFTGTVDIFHLQNSYPTTNWKEDYNQNKKLNARILFVDPSSRAVGLTLNPHLVRNKAPPAHVKIGDICDDAKVVRVDRGLGLLLEIPSTQISTPAYVSISDVAEEVRKLEKKFKEGTHVRVRILGFRYLEGLATGILKASAFEGSVFTHSDVKPGMVVRGKIIAVDSFGAIVQFPGGVKALCPLTHMSEFEIAKPKKKFKIGAELIFRVLGCKSKRITVTHKKTLVKSKLGILSSYADAADGLITHGWIRKIEERGCFVHFYNGVQGFAPRSELGLEPGSDPNAMYHVGQVVKCRIIGANATSRRIKLSLIIRPPRVSEDDMVKLGSLVSGVVDRVTPNAVVVYVNAKGYSMGTIFTDHLADHHGLAALMKSVLKPGYEFDQLLVLDTEGNNLILSAKPSLINSAPKLPSEVSQVHPNTVLHGYICNLIDTGCFVRFLGRVTGFSPRHKAMDDHKGDLSEAFYIGQSVRSTILDVNTETGRITLSLKQSSCSSTDASFIQEYFMTEEKVAKLQSSDSKEFKPNWSEGFSIGSVVEGKVQEAKDIGVVVSFERYSDVFGFITHYQLAGTTIETGSIVRTVVLDVAKAEHLVDLSLKPEFSTKLKQESSKSQTNIKKRRREVSDDPVVHETVNAVVEIVKDNYLVLSIPKYNYAVGYASVSDYNTQKFPQKQFLNGQSVNATVMALPGPATAGRLLLLLNSLSESADTSGSKRAKKKSSYKVGSVVQAEITEIKPLELRLKFGIGFHGRVHITEVNDDALEDPFNFFRIGQTVTALIVAKTNFDNNKKSFQWDLSLKPSLLAGSCEIEGKVLNEDLAFSIGNRVTGYVSKVDAEWVWLTISRNVRAQLFILDSSCEPSELQDFQKRFNVGNAVSAHVMSVSKDKKLLRLVSYPFDPVSKKAGDQEVSKTDAKVSMLSATAHIREGCVVGGRIIKILPGIGGLTVQIGPHMYGRVHYSELSDSWVSNPLSGYEEGQFVKCKVLERSLSGQGTVHFDLSLRSSLVGTLCQDFSGSDSDKHTPTEHLEKIDDLKPNMVIQGYVKNVSSKGCFILLSRKLDAKILVSNLSDGYIDDPEKEFPVGKLVTGRVSSVEPLSKRVEVTLKSLSASSSSQSARNTLDSLHVGDIISGRIKRLESYGIFITIDNTNVVGLCHVSELSEDKKDNFETKYSTGERVTAKVLKVDKERHRVSLGMKDLYIMDNSDPTPPKQELDESIRHADLVDDTKPVMCSVGSFLEDQNVDIDHEIAEFQSLVQAESRASVPPLEVTLDDVGQGDDFVSKDEELLEVDTVDDKKKKLPKKKARDEREREIRAAEERLLEKDIPRNDEEFEKLVRSSPNNSYVWIKYMEFVLSMADVEKARSIAKRALETINFREENEKLNVWVAYFNLESKYGSPPEVAVMKVFQKALQYHDPKKVHLALLGVFERSELHKLADELADNMIKRFKKSCKVWLRRVQRLLLQQQDGVQDLVSRAEKILPKHKQIKFLSQTAILEFKCGNPERGRSLFENILRQNPKRTDLWSVYLDQEIRLGDTDLIHALFERATSLSLPAKKMKFLFKKYLDYEERHGNEERANYVKQKAMSYVENTVA